MNHSEGEYIKDKEPIRKETKGISMHITKGTRIANKHMEDAQFHPSSGKRRI